MSTSFLILDIFYTIEIDLLLICVLFDSPGFADLFFIDTNPFVNKYFEQPKNHNYDWRGILPREKYVSNLIKVNKYHFLN